MLPAPMTRNRMRRRYHKPSLAWRPVAASTVETEPTEVDQKAELSRNTRARVAEKPMGSEQTYQSSIGVHSDIQLHSTSVMNQV